MTSLRENAAIIMMISYGYQINDENDHYVQLSDDALSTFAKCGLFGTFMVDYFPVCKWLESTYLRKRFDTHSVKYLPMWFPGASFKRQASNWSKPVGAMINEPFAMVKTLLVSPNLGFLLISSKHSTLD